MFRDAPIDNLNLQPKIKHKMMFSLCSLWTTCHNFISDILWQICREQNVCKSAINSASLIWWQENNVSRARACKWVTKYRFIKRKKNEKEKSALRDNSIRVKVRSKWIVTRRRCKRIDENRDVWSLKCRQDFYWWLINKKKKKSYFVAKSIEA